jgi:hypothetical protein
VSSVPPRPNIEDKDIIEDNLVFRDLKHSNEGIIYKNCTIDLREEELLQFLRCDIVFDNCLILGCELSKILTYNSNVIFSNSEILNIEHIHLRKSNIILKQNKIKSTEGIESLLSIEKEVDIYIRHLKLEDVEVTVNTNNLKVLDDNIKSRIISSKITDQQNP